MRKKIMIGLALIAFSLFIINVTILAANAQSYVIGVNKGNAQKNMMNMMGETVDHTSCPNFVDVEGAGMMEMHSNIDVQHPEHCSRQNAVP